MLEHLIVRESNGNCYLTGLAWLAIVATYFLVGMAYIVVSRTFPRLRCSESVDDGYCIAAMWPFLLMVASPVIIAYTISAPFRLTNVLMKAVLGEYGTQCRKYTIKTIVLLICLAAAVALDLYGFDQKFVVGCICLGTLVSILLD